MSKAIKRYNGISLLELTLVLTVIMIITLLGISLYQHMQQHALAIAVHNDEQTLNRYLDNYFQSTGCNQNGTFSKLSGSNVQYEPSIVNDLGLSTDYQARLPLVLRYSVFIIDTGQKTLQDNPPKPIYYLKVEAKLNAPASLMTWYQQELNAQGFSGTTLFWRSYPNTSTVQPNKELWILDGSRLLFRRLEDSLTTNSPNVSGSFCAQ